MAYTDTVGDLLRVTIAVTYPDSQVQEVNHNFVCTASGGGDGRAALGAFVLGVWTAGYGAVLPSTASFYGYKVALVNRKPPPFPKALISVTAGTASTVLMSTQTRPILSWQTPNAGRSARGRTFAFTPASATMASTGYPGGSLNTALNTIATALVAGTSSGGTTWLPVLAHRVKGPPVTWSFTLLTAGNSAQKFGTQRKSGNYGRVNTPPW